jgi:hypothetical protein
VIWEEDHSPGRSNWLICSWGSICYLCSWDYNSLLRAGELCCELDSYKSWDLLFSDYQVMCTRGEVEVAFPTSRHFLRVHGHLTHQGEQQYFFWFKWSNTKWNKPTVTGTFLDKLPFQVLQESKQRSEFTHPHLLLLQLQQPPPHPDCLLFTLAN